MVFILFYFVKFEEIDSKVLGVKVEMKVGLQFILLKLMAYVHYLVLNSSCFNDYKPSKIIQVPIYVVLG